METRSEQGNSDLDAEPKRYGDVPDRSFKMRYNVG